MLVEAFTDILKKDDEVQELIAAGKLLQTIGAIEDGEDDDVPPIMLGARQAVLSRLSSYEHADIDKCLKRSIAYISMVYRLCPFTAVTTDQLNYEDILVNLDSKRQSYLEQLHDSGMYMTHEELLAEYPEMLDECSRTFIDQLATNLFDPTKFYSDVASLMRKAVRMFIEAHSDDMEEEAHEYMYGHVKAPFEFANFDWAMKGTAKLEAALFDDDELN